MKTHKTLIILTLIIALNVPKYFIDPFIILGLIVLIYEAVFIKNISVNKTLLLACVSIFKLMCISTISYLYYGDSFGLIRATRVLFLIFFSVYLLEKLSHTNIKNILLITIVFNTLLIYLEYINPANIGEHIKQLNYIFYTSRDFDYRAKGLFPGYSYAGVFLGFSSVYLLYLITIESQVSLILLLFFLATAISTIFTSRTGILISVTGIFFLIFFHPSLFFYNIKIYSKSILIAVVTITLYLLFNFKIKSFVNEDVLSMTLIRAFEFYTNFQQTNSLHVASTEALFETFAIPNKFPDIIIGNGMQHWINPENIFNTDSGWGQSLVMYGVIGSVIYYMPIFLIFKKHLTNHTSRVIIAIFILLAALAHIKGNYLYSNQIFIMLYSIAILSQPVLKNIRK